MKQFSTIITTLLFILAAGVFAHGAVFVVTNTNDSGPGSLRQAIIDANLNGEDDVINFDPAVFSSSQTILLTSGDLMILPDNESGTIRTLTINGPGANLLEINGNDHSRIFRLENLAQAVIDKVKLSGGNGTSAGEVPDINSLGGAILTRGGVTAGRYNLQLTNSIVSGNRSTHNFGFAGGIMVFGRVLVVNCAVVGNESTFDGGGIFIGNAELRMFNSTVSGNRSRLTAGIYLDSGLLHLTNSLVVNNYQSIDSLAPAGINLKVSQFTYTNFYPQNSIIALNRKVSGEPFDISGPVRSRGNNIFGTSAGIDMLESSPTDLLDLDPQIDAGLSLNGGVIPSHALRAGSPAIDSGNNCVLIDIAAGGCSDVPITYDHRGTLRPQDADGNGTATVDRGTFEVLASEIANVPGTPDLRPEDDTGVSNSDNITAGTQLSFDVPGLTSGATLELLRNGVTIATAIATGPSMTLEDTTLTDAGTYIYTARQVVGGVASLQGGSLNVVFDNVAPSGTVSRAGGQASPTRLQPINFALVLSEPVLGFEAEDISLSGSTAGTGSAAISLSGNAPNFNIQISNLTSDGNVVASVAPGTLQDLAGNTNLLIGGAGNSVILDTTGPSVTINQAATQADPVRPLPINFTVVFSEPITGLTSSDISLAGSTANVGSASRTVTGSGTTYNIAISGVTSNGGSVVVSIPAGGAIDAAGNQNLASTSIDNSVILDNVGPNVTVNQSISQADPTGTMPVNYTVVFSEVVTGFDRFDVVFTNSTISTLNASVEITGSGTTYNIAVGNVSSAGGWLRVSVRGGAALDSLGNSSFASTSIDNSVLIDTVAPSVSVNQAASQIDPSAFQPILFQVVFSENVDNFGPDDVSLAGSVANVSRANISVAGSGNFYTVSVGGVTTSGPLVVTVPAGGAYDPAGNSNRESTSIDNSVTVIVPWKPFDFDGDAKSDLGIFRPSLGEWWIDQSSTGDTYAGQFGTADDVIVPADFTGDAKSDIALWRPSTGEWLVLRSEDYSYFAFPFGSAGDVPVPGDYDVDGRTDAAIYRPASSTWFIRRTSDGGTTIQTFGREGDQPVPSDYDGDGRTDIAIYRPNGGQGAEWWINRSNDGLMVANFGASGDKTVPGDYTGDGKADVAFFRPASGDWFVLRSEDLSFFSFPFGSTGDLPAPGDYDGDGKYDATVFRPSETNWYVRGTSAGILIKQFGLAGDKPIANAYVR